MPTYKKEQKTNNFANQRISQLQITRNSFLYINNEMLCSLLGLILSTIGKIKKKIMSEHYVKKGLFPNLELFFKRVFTAIQWQKYSKQVQSLSTLQFLNILIRY